jgi:predicted ATP-grasp superfamily ATP-dependent carboligase
MSLRRQFACVLGGVDLMRAIGMTGVPCASVSPEGALPRYSRFCKATVRWHDPTKEPEALLEALLEFARTQVEPPVLFYQGDGDTLFISRFRHLLDPYFRFVIPDAHLTEDLIDKERFQALAHRLGLPVPPSVTLTPATPPAAKMRLSFPALVKPLARQLAVWQPMAGHAKAVQVDSFDALVDVWQKASSYGTSVLVQQLIPGDETRIESYHVYVDARGRTVAAFTGRKVRTFPVRFGQSTALELTTAEDVASLAEDLVRRMKLRGVAKLDFKRDPDGHLHLLEVNPRFNLWHHLGAMAGINLPALIYADLTGGARPITSKVVPGMGWSRPLEDLRSVRSSGGSLGSWLRWTMKASARSGISPDDPLLMFGWALRRVSGLRGRRASEPAAPG